MDTNTIDAALCSKMFHAGARNLEAKKEWINELNVFPVPDGDTGTNMTLTIMSAVKEVDALETLNLASFGKAISSGSLRGARGNSGVILSQLLRGFAKVLSAENEITTSVLASALQKGAETAYKAVIKPKEGTLLTVAREIADHSAKLLENDPDIEMKELLGEIIKSAEDVLERTPEMLPVLKEAGVVDSGGQGFVQILKGAYDAFNGIEIPENINEKDFSSEESNTAGSDLSGLGQASDSTADDAVEGTGKKIKGGYYTEFTIIPEKEYSEKTEEKLKAYLESVGDSVSVAARMPSDNDTQDCQGSGYAHVDVFVHTDDPGHVVSFALRYGSLIKIRIKNVCESADQTESNRTVMQEKEEKTACAKDDVNAADTVPDEPCTDSEDIKEVGFISVSAGDGLSSIFNDLGVDCLVEGGQTMNPSTEEILNAIDQTNAENVIILPNNKNIILAANQAKNLAKDKNVFVIPTRTIPQGITAIINYTPEKSAEENVMVMEEEIARVKTGQLTYAVRDTHVDDKEICAGDIMGIGDNSILAVGKDIESVAEETVSLMMSDDAELISIYYGKDISEDDASSLCEIITESYPYCDVELNYGGQPNYYYIISVE